MSAPILVPTLGESVTEATVAKWLKKSGDTVNEDEPLIELETDKVSVEVTSPKTGVITEITVQEGQTVEVGAQLGLIGKSGAKVATQPEESEKPKIEKIEVEQEIKPKPKKEKEEKVIQLNVERKSEPSPAAKRVIEENKIDISSVHGTGRRGQILKSDLI